MSRPEFPSFLVATLLLHGALVMWPVVLAIVKAETLFAVHASKMVSFPACHVETALHFPAWRIFQAIYSLRYQAPDYKSRQD